MFNEYFISNEILFFFRIPLCNLLFLFFQRRVRRGGQLQNVNCATSGSGIHFELDYATRKEINVRQLYKSLC